MCVSYYCAIEQVYQWGDSAWDEVEEWTKKEDDGKVYFDPFAVGGSMIH